MHCLVLIETLPLQLAVSKLRSVFLLKFKQFWGIYLKLRFGMLGNLLFGAFECCYCLLLGWQIVKIITHASSLPRPDLLTTQMLNKFLSLQVIIWSASFDTTCLDCGLILFDILLTLFKQLISHFGSWIFHHQ
jgi:hypothetical protein